MNESTKSGEGEGNIDIPQVRQRVSLQVELMGGAHPSHLTHDLLYHYYGRASLEIFIIGSIIRQLKFFIYTLLASYAKREHIPTIELVTPTNKL